MRSLLCVLCATCPLLLSSWCYAQGTSSGAEGEPSAAHDPKELARKLYAEGSRLYDQADYAGAIAAFEQAYAAYPAAALLFNLAQAERLLGPTHCQKALDYYERYRQTPESAADREEVEVHMAEMRGCVTASAAASSAKAPAAPALSTPVTPPPRQLAPAEAPSSGPVPTSAYVLGALGVVGLATFGTLAIVGRNQQAKLESSCSPACSRGELRPMKTSFVVADIGLALGVISLGAAGYLVLSRPPPLAGQAHLNDGAELQLLGHF